MSPSVPSITVVEVSPRDGLQNEQAVLPTATKVSLIDRLSAAGLTTIEVTSFVSPKAIPQLADAEAVMAGITRIPGVRYTVLVPNERGLDRAMPTRPDGIVVFAAASETFSRRNINCTVAESIDRFRPVVRRAREAGLHVRGTISCALGCPYEGEIAPAAVVRLTQELLALGVHEISIADTIGVGTAERTAQVFDAVLEHVAAAMLNAHFHDTYRRAIENLEVCLARGVRSVDASAAGLGGCPFAPGASGNVATESVLALAAARGFATGVDPEAVAAAGAWIRGELSVRG